MLEPLVVVVWLLELALALAISPTGVAYFARRRARRDFPRALVVVLLVALGACASSRPPALLQNVEPPPAPAVKLERVCDNFLVKPAMYCFGRSMLFFDGCRWVCIPIDVQ